jgi:uncharacterized protein (DUF342 family)
MKQLFSEKTEQFSITGKLSDDRMKVFIEGTPGTTRGQIAATHITQILTRHVPQRLIHERVVHEIAEMLSRGEIVSERRICRGQDAVPGTDGKLVMMVKAFNQKPELAEDERGFTQLNELHLFDNVIVGQELARIYPPHAGKDGFDAFGKVIAAKPGKPFKPSYDKKTVQLRVQTATHESLCAQIDGYVELEAGAVRVVDTLTVSGNVDYHIGNIDFVGAVAIRGDVMQGFTVRAVKGISVEGAVHKASLFCSKGSIECKGRIAGGDHAQIVASGDLRARVLHEVVAEVGGDVIVEKEAYDCALYIEGAFIADSATLLGGELRSALGVQAKHIGLESAKSTKITLCSTIETRREFMQLLAQIESHERALNLLKLHLGPLALKPERIQLLRDLHRQKMLQLLEKMRSVDRSLVSLRVKKEQLLQSVQNIEGLRVNVTGHFYPGVEVIAGQHHYHEKEGVSGPKSLIFDAKMELFSWIDYQVLEPRVDGDKGGKDERKNK